MKNGLTLILFWLPMLLWSQISIYDIQYTTDAGADWTYPSPYAGQAVTTEGIVTVANVQGGRYYLSAEEGGAWNGIYIYDTSNKPSVGDKVRLTGTVYEYKGYTEITSVTSFDVLSTSNALPPGAEISSIRVDDEAYEGVLVKVTDCKVTSTYDTYGNWGVDSGSGQCVIRSGIYNAQGDGVPLFLNYPFESVTGIVAQYYGVCLLPRNREDLVSAEGGFILSFDDLDADGKKSVDLSIDVTLFSQTDDINSYELNMSYDATSFSYEGYSTEGAISAGGTINDHSTPGNINLTFSGNVSCSNTKQLIVLKFKPLKIGSANLQFTSSRINGKDHPYLKSGNLFCSFVACDAPQADMVTVVQRPLLNIPSIVKPGELLNIECFAPQSTTDWDAELIYDNHVVDLNITQADYDSHLEKWTLQALVPTVEFYELYDLHVRASGGISDVTNNSVKVIKQYKDEYYFIQITDLHLLGHTFWGEEGYKEDNTEMDDLREVIDDINLLQPEFV
ncbi:MAG: hypothetical protein N4A74_16105, partial [Carboxylicivirga sp.]|nr:hypothetical protein [Carboxylicivirga sp.]